MRVRSLGCAVFVLLCIGAPAATAAVQLTPVERVPFPSRQYVVDLGRDVSLNPRAVHVSENGAAVDHFTLRPLSSSSLRGSVVLAIDASNSMAGKPFAAAVAAARSFAEARAGTEKIGVVTFNGDVNVVQTPTAGPDVVASFDRLPKLAQGTHIYDAVVASLGVLRASNAATKVIVVLSDGADVGSAETLESAVAMARRDHVRVFTIGLASAAYDPKPLQLLAAETGASYFEATSALELGSIYTTLGNRLANQYLLTYRSEAIPTSSVTLRVDAAGVGSSTVDYIAPKPRAIAPFHRSLFRRFVTSAGATVLISLLVALLIIGVVALLFRRPKSGITGRIEQFVATRRPAVQALKTGGAKMQATLMSSQHAGGRMQRLQRDLEIANADITAGRLVALTVGGTLFVSLLLAMLFPPLLILSLMLIPIAARGWVTRKLRRVRDEFADQLPANLQVLASAMRAGHSLNGALAVVVDNSHEPSRRELRRAVNDDKLGIPIDEALRRVAERMDNRDLQQVALLSELQRSAGGNAAEVLDTVVETIRERTDVRRLVQTLTAQGRMARWILTGLPVVVAGLLWLMQPGIMTPFFSSTGGQFALVLAALMTMAGSLIIQRMVDIEV